MKKILIGLTHAALWVAALFVFFCCVYYFSLDLTEQDALFITVIFLSPFFLLWLLIRHIVKRRKANDASTAISRPSRAKRKIRPVIPAKTNRIPSRILLVIGLIAVLLFPAGMAVHRAAAMNAIPESLQEMKDRYPETAGFVNNYSKEAHRHHDMDISDEVQKGKIPLFLQWDKRWGYEPYGSNVLGITGCGPTCLSMVYSGLTGHTDKNPYQMALFSEEHGYYVDGQGTSWDLMTKGAESLGLHAQQLEVSSPNIQDALSSGQPIICSMYPGDFTTSGHFIVLSGIDADGNVTVNDPNSKINSGKTWHISRLLPQIHAMWKYIMIVKSSAIE